MKLAIGSAQFGLNYGITNTKGKVVSDEIKNILEIAHNNNINTIDTASGYGKSESLLGSLINNDWNVITKIKPIKRKLNDAFEEVFNQVRQSMDNLKLNNIYAVLLHKPLQLIEDNGDDIWNCLNKLKADGVIKKIGFSVYNPSELETLWQAGFVPNIVQAPYNIFDRRIKTSGWLLKLKQEKIEVHARSIFLQGLLLLRTNKMPEYFNEWKTHFNKWETWLNDNNIRDVSAALNFALSEKFIDKVIIGVDNKEQLIEILKLYSNDEIIIPKEFEIFDQNLLNPYNWNLN